MRGIVLWLATPGRHAGFHALTFSAAITGIMMCVTAADLGPLAPLVIAHGLHVIFFALASEIVLGLQCLVRAGARRALRQWL